MTDIRAAILGADDLERVTVAVPEWDMEVLVRGLTAGEVEEFGNAINNGKSTNMMARMVVAVVIHEDGSPVFTADDLDAVAGKNSGVIKRLFDAAQEASGLGEDHTGN